MGPELAPEPWRSFLADIDRTATQSLVLHCIGGFAVSLYYGLSRPTGDIDVVEVAPSEAKGWLASTAGRGSPFHRKHKVYLDVVTVATVPYSYEDRLTEIFPRECEKLRLFVLDPYDLALSKLTRNLEVDLEDVKYLARSSNLDLRLLEGRYEDELRPYVSGPVERHDQTLRLWLEVIREERGRSENH
jgi:hypothetical protein